MCRHLIQRFKVHEVSGFRHGANES